MAEATRVNVDEARRKVASGSALLVCAYDEEEKCNRIKLEGAMSLGALRSREGSLAKDQAIIFYCA